MILTKLAHLFGPVNQCFVGGLNTIYKIIFLAIAKSDFFGIFLRERGTGGKQ